jgi:hypothetical protein
MEMLLKVSLAAAFAVSACTTPFLADPRIRGIGVERSNHEGPALSDRPIGESGSVVASSDDSRQICVVP